MKKNNVFFILILFLCGCVTAREMPPAAEAPTENNTPVLEPLEPLPAGENVPPPAAKESQETKEEKKPLQNGVVFFKADFQGVLQTKFVKVGLSSRKDPLNQLQFYVGQNPSDQKFPKNLKKLEPGYFSLELSAGEYVFSSIAIPVGTTMAEEELHVLFSVVPETVSYLGTLKVVGTKEKIKLGGVPVIKPGFEYVIEIVDEQEEGIRVFQEKYPDISKEIEVRLMKQ